MKLQTTAEKQKQKQKNHIQDTQKGTLPTLILQ